MVRSQDGEVFQSTLYKGQPMGRPLRKKRLEIMKRFLLQGNYVMFDYFHTRVYPFENLRVILPNFHPTLLPYPSSFAKWKARCCWNWSPPCCLNRKLWRRTPWTEFFQGFQWYTRPSLKVDFDSDSIGFENILSCTGVCVKQSPFRARSWISNSHSNWKIGLVQSEIISFSLNLPNPWF